MASDKKYIYCNVLPANYQTTYFYICDFDVKPGDFVLISIRNNNNEKAALVLDVNEYTESNAPYPPEWTKHVLRPLGDNENDDLKKQLMKLEAEKADRFKSDDQLEKLAVKEALIRYGVGGKAIKDSKAKLKALLEKMPDKNETVVHLITDLSDGIHLSADGKTVIGFRAKKTKGRVVIHIPSGVETIEDNAFLRVNIDELFIPKELREIGIYTIHNPYGYGPYDINPKNMASIIVEEGNEHYYSDGIGFYSIQDGKKRLECMLDKELTEYVCPDDVKSFAFESFAFCRNLKHVILSDGTEEFDEYCLPCDTKVEEVYIPKTVKKLHVKSAKGAYSTWNTSSYRIDEESEYLFRDEDSIYEILEDGTYKLLTNLYHGKGKVLILEGTSMIGEGAFEGHKNFTKIEFPKSLRIIGERAFRSTALKSVVVPDYVQRIETSAFENCSNLKSVQLSANLEYIAEDTFEGCMELHKINSDGKEKAFSLKNGVVRKLVSTGRTDTIVSATTTAGVYPWMTGKNFVHTGLSDADEREFEAIVKANGGEVKNSTVLTTDYLVYNADYDHETIKLRRARELEDEGREIKIITFEEWNDLLESGESVDVAPVPETVEPQIPDKDYFDEFAKEIVQTIKEESVSVKDRVNDRANYDESKRVITITTLFSQSARDTELVKERVACAESLSVGSPILVKMKGNTWEATSIDGKSLGELGSLLARKSIPYMNFITVSQGSVADIMPKSKRRSGAKCATGSVKFEITERSIEGLSEQDLQTRKLFAYSIDDNEATLVRWIADDSVKKAVLPASIEGKPVIAVSSGLFEPDTWTGLRNQIEEIVFSEGIKRIEAKVLFYIEKLKKVVFPASVDYVDPNVFSYENGEYKDLFLNKETVYVAPADSYAEKFLKEYKPNHYGVKVLTVINDDSEEANAEIKLLSVFDIEQGEKGIVAKFKDGYMLDDFKEKNVTIPNKVNGQPLEIFDVYGIPNSVKKLVFPATITAIENMESSTLFYSSGHGLEKIEIAEENKTFWSDGYSIFTKDKKTLLRFMAYTAKSYNVPEGTETIGRFSFSNMEKLETLVLPKSIKKIDDHAFYHCKVLANIQGMELVTEVGNKIFAGEGWASGGSIPFEQNTPVLIIGSTLLRNNELSQKIIKVPEGITTIDESAFGWKNDNDQVEEIVLPESVRVIGKTAFCGRKLLKKVNIPEGVKEIPENLFSLCEKLETIYIPASVEKIDISAFPTYSAAKGFSQERPCAFKAVEVDPNNNYYCSVNGMLLSKDRTELLFIPNGVQGSDFEIPDGVNIINASSASGNAAITELILPNSVTVIGSGAFSDCGNLKKVVFPEGLEEIGKYAFSSCSALKTIVWPKRLKTIGYMAFNETGLEEIKLPDTIEHIGSQAFAKTPISKVTLPKSVRTLGWGAFSCVPEIEVYDTIDPEAGEANQHIDTCNGSPNSMVGYIGMGPAWAMWDCAANHIWANYTVIVRSAETDEIKYKVWMGADSSQRDYYCFLSSGWGHNATFAFGQLDEFFPKIRGKDNKLQVAKYRLEYPYELADEAKVKYEAFVKENS